MEIDHYFRKKGIESITAYGWGPKYENAYRINNYFEYYFHNIMSRITGLEGYFSLIPTIKLIRKIKKYKPDCIILQNIHGHFLNFPIFFGFLKTLKIPILNIVHDCWCFTGKCGHYTISGCDKWTKECGNCPKLREYPQSYIFDNTKFMLKKKKEWFGNLYNLHAVGVSDWITNEAAKSFLGKNKAYRVYNWINRDIFKKYESSNFGKYNIPNDKFTIIGVSASWAKNSQRYKDFVKLSKMIDPDMQIVLIGGEKNAFQGENVIHIPFISDTKELANLYSSADVYVHFSLEDTFGKVIAEAQATGTPAIVYRSTACKEIVNDKITGYVADAKNVEEVYNYIKEVKKNGKEYYSENCIKWVNENFNYEKNCEQLLEIIKETM